MQNHHQNLIDKVDDLLNDTTFMLDLLNFLWLEPMLEEDYNDLKTAIVSFIEQELNLPTKGQTGTETRQLKAIFDWHRKELFNKAFHYEWFEFTHYDRATSVNQSAENIVKDYLNQDMSDDSRKTFNPISRLEKAEDSYNEVLFNVAQEAIIHFIAEKGVHNKKLKLLMTKEDVDFTYRDQITKKVIDQVDAPLTERDIHNQSAKELTEKHIEILDNKYLTFLDFMYHDDSPQCMDEFYQVAHHIVNEYVADNFGLLTVHPKYDIQDITPLAQVTFFTDLDEDEFLLDLTLEKEDNHFSLKSVGVNENRHDLPAPMKEHIDNFIQDLFVPVIEQKLENLSPHLIEKPTEYAHDHIIERLELEQQHLLTRVQDKIFQITHTPPSDVPEMMLARIKDVINDIPDYIKPYNLGKLRYEAFINWDKEKQSYVLTEEEPGGFSGIARFVFELDNRIMTSTYKRAYNEKYTDINY